MEEYKLSKSSKKNLSGIHKGLHELVMRVIKKSPYDFGIPEYGGLRTAQEQNNLFHRRPKVTSLDGFKRKSYHQTGNAFDIFIFFDGKADWSDPEKYRAVWEALECEFKVMQEEGIFCKHEFFEWGGDWVNFKDYPHFQLVEKL
jgi:peptidoglycan L-alanyl-D-glutamate endopeptidase CwlK